MTGVRRGVGRTSAWEVGRRVGLEAGRLHAVAFAVLLLVGSLVAPALAQEKIVLTITSHGNAEEQQLYERLFAEYSQLHPNVEIRWAGVDWNIEPIMLRMAAGSDVPDIIVLRSGLAVDQLHLLDLTPYVGKYMTEEDLSDFHPAQWSTWSREGKQYAIPRYMGTVVTVYNRDMFLEAGVEEPKGATFTWDEMAATARKLTRDTTGDGVADRWGYFVNWAVNRMAHWVWQNGGDFFNEAGDVTIDRPEFVGAWEFLANLRFSAGVMPTVQQVSNARSGFGQERIAMMEDGDWAVPGIIPPFIEGRFRMGVAEPPYNRTRATVHTLDGYGIWSGTKHPDEAFRFVQWLTGPRGNQAFAEYGLPPARRSELGYYLRLYENEVDLSVLAAVRGYARPIPEFSEDVTRILNEAATAIARNGQGPVASILSDAARRIRGLQQ